MRENKYLEVTILEYTHVNYCQKKIIHHSMVDWQKIKVKNKFVENY